VAFLERLWPFFRHPIAAVRRSVLQIVPALVRAGGAALLSSPAVVAELLALLFQTYLVEEHAVRRGRLAALAGPSRCALSVPLSC